MLIGTWTAYGYHILIITILRWLTSELLRPFFYAPPVLERRGLQLWRKWLRHEKLHRHVKDSFEPTLNSPVHIRLYTLYPSFNIQIEVYNWRLYADIIRHIHWIIIFNFSIRFIWLNATYITPNFFAPILNKTVPLVKHRVITNGPIYGISYSYAVCFVRMNLSPSL